MVSANNVVEGLKGQAQNMVQTVALAIKGNKGQIPELWTQLATSNPGPEWVNIAERRLHKGDVPGAKAVLQVVLEGQTVSNAAHAHLLLIQAFLLSGQDSLIEALSVAR